MYLKKFIIFTTVLLLSIGLIIYSADISSEIRIGIDVCLNILIPSLFSFIVLSTFLVKTWYAKIFVFPIKWIIKKIYSVDDTGSIIVFLSLIGGYPVGANLVVTNLSDGNITKEESERLICFCVNSGPAFIVGAVAIPIFNNISIGLIIYLSHIISSAIIANITRNKKYTNSEKTNEAPPMKISDALVCSTRLACSTMLSVCSLVIVFSAIMTILEKTQIINFIISLSSSFTDKDTVTAFIYGFLEICKGCTKISSLHGLNKILMASGLTAFGGLCVHLQVISITNKFKLNMRKYFITRLIYSIISIVCTYFLLTVFSIDIPAFAIQVSSFGSSVNNHLSSALLIGLSILLLLNTEKSDSICNKISKTN